MLLYSDRNLLQCHFDHHKSHTDYCVIVPRALQCESADLSPELCYMTVWIYVMVVQRAVGRAQSEQLLAVGWIV